MKCIRCILILLSFFVEESVSSQILKNNILPDVIVINRKGFVDSLFASEVISKYYATLEKGFRQVGLPRFIRSGVRTKDDLWSRRKYKHAFII